MNHPNLYESTKSLANQAIQRLLPPLLDQVTWECSDRILDFGCGTGSTTVKFLLPKLLLLCGTEPDPSLHITGVDISAKMIQVANSTNLHPLLTFYQSDILDLYYKNCPAFQNLYNHVVSVNVLHHIHDYSGALRRIYEILEYGGTASFIVYTDFKMFQMHWNLKYDPMWNKYMGELMIPDWFIPGEKSDKVASSARENISLALTSAGFQILNLDDVALSHDVLNFSELMDHYVSCNSALSKVPPELIPDLTEAYSKFYRPYIFNQCHNPTLEHTLLTFVAKKQK